MKLADVLRNALSSLLNKFINNNDLINLLVSILMVTFWVLLAYVTLKIVKRIILKSDKLTKHGTREQYTIRRVVNNAIRALFMFWIVIMVLGELGLDLMPVLAGAGVLAFAIGFGAQELIKDVISGFFLIVEKTFSIGDFVTINDYDGTVADIGIRRTKLENWKGQVITINNGDIKTVVNHSILESVGSVEMSLDPKFDINHFTSPSFLQFLEDFKNNHEEVIETPGIPVVLEVTPNVKVRVSIKTKTRQHIKMEREFRKEILLYFDKHNLTTEIPVLIKDFN